jgi:hypothetical protein
MASTNDRSGWVKLFAKGLAVALLCLVLTVKPAIATELFTMPLGFFRVYHIFWLGAMLILVKRFIPRLNWKMSSGKVYARNFTGFGQDSESRRMKFEEVRREADGGAVRSAVYWTLIVLTTGLFRLVGIFDTAWLFAASAFFVFMDEFCITVWCPFKWLTKTKCCNTCRINNWGYLMAFSPLLFVPSFWTYSLLFLAAAVVVHWEYLYHRHPERFYEQYNARLMCKNCTLKQQCSR